MQIDDCINAVSRAKIDHSVEVFESRLLDHARVQVIFKVPVVDPQGFRIVSRMLSLCSSQVCGCS